MAEVAYPVGQRIPLAKAMYASFDPSVATYKLSPMRVVALNSPSRSFQQVLSATVQKAEKQSCFGTDSAEATVVSQVVVSGLMQSRSA